MKLMLLLIETSELVIIPRYLMETFVLRIVLALDIGSKIITREQKAQNFDEGD